MYWWDGLYQFPKRRLHNPYLQSPSPKHGRGVWGVDAKRLLCEWANVAAKQRIDIDIRRDRGLTAAIDFSGTRKMQTEALCFSRLSVSSR